MAEVEGEGGNNHCGCDKTTCSLHNKDGVCSDPTCKVYKSCCEPGCKGCKRNCNGVKQPEKCKCRIPVCGCKTNCYESNSGKDGKCQGLSSNCERCKIRCQGSTKCICYFCSCGTQCNGVICSCCSWCDPKNCSGEKCNGYVLGKCGPEGCKGHVKYDEGDPVWNRGQTNKISCDKSHKGECIGNNCNWFRGELQPDGNCVKFCKYCGTLCGQDKFRRCCYIAIPVVIIVLAFLIFRFMLPEKFQSMMTKIRAALPISSRRPVRSFTNLVGDKILEETNIDRYAAFRPRAYAGLA